MRVVLLNPPAYRGILYVREGRCEQRLSSFQYNMLPISLPSTAALLRQGGHEVRLVDAIARRLTGEDLVREMREFSPEVILVNASTASFPGDADTAARLKEWFPHAFIAAFGVHVTALPGPSLKESRFDGVIRREPEVTAAELVRHLEEKRPLDEVPGLSFRVGWRAGRTGSPFRHNSARPFLADLDSLPFPARDLVDHRLYPAPISGRPHTLIVTSRGCPHSCIFCTARLFYGSRLRLRDPVQIGKEIAEAYERQGLRLFTFWSDTFTLNREHVVGICREIQRRGLEIEWMCNSRVDRIDPELLRLMAVSGCRTISFGVESGAQEILDGIKKDIRVEQIIQAFAWCRERGIKSAAHLIFGLPGETPDTIRRTLKLVRRIRPDYAQFYGAIPFPGTPFHRRAIREGWLRARRWEDYEINQNLITTPALSAQELGTWRRKAFISFYLRPGYLLDRLADVRRPEDFAHLVVGGLDFLRHWVLSSASAPKLGGQPAE